MTDDEFNTFAKRRFVIDCPQITLTQNTKDNPKRFEGSGSIYQDEDGRLRLKLFSQERFDLKKQVEEWNRKLGQEPGRIVPSTEYFTLSAKQLGGAEWASPQVFPDTSNDEAHLIVTGEPWLITNTSAYPTTKSGSRLRIRILGQVPYPANAATMHTITLGTQSERKHHSYNVAEFNAEDLQLSLHSDRDWTILDVQSKGAMPTLLETRIIEALSFVLARRVAWACSEITTSVGTTTTLRSLPDYSPDTRILPPLTLKGVPNPAPYVWDMFACYLKTALEDDSSPAHPLSKQVFSVLNSGQAPIEAEALTLGVAVEGALKIAFPDKKNRTKGWAHKKLDALASKGVVSKEAVKFWKKRRDDSAHGNHIDLDDTEKLDILLTECRNCLALFYKIVFGAIGYTGAYTDYSQDRWPTIGELPAVLDNVSGSK